MIYIVVGSHNITLLDELPTEIIKKNCKSLCIRTCRLKITRRYTVIRSPNILTCR
jgi:hypothetical protein